MEIQCLFRAVLCLFVCTVCKVSYRTSLFCLFLRCGVLSLCWYASCRSIWKKRLNSSYSSKAKQIAWPPKQKWRPWPLPSSIFWLLVTIDVLTMTSKNVYATTLRHRNGWPTTLCARRPVIPPSGRYSPGAKFPWWRRGTTTTMRTTTRATSTPVRWSPRPSTLFISTCRWRIPATRGTPPANSTGSITPGCLPSPEQTWVYI